MTAQIGDAAANPVFTDVLSQGTSLGSLNAQSLVQLRGQATVMVQVTAIGTLTLSFEATVDGTNFFAINMFPVLGGISVTSTTTNGQWVAVISGAYQFRTRASLWTSGSALVSSNAAQGTNEQQVQSGTAQGIASAGLVGQLIQGNVTTAAPTYTTGNSNPLSLTTTGAVRSAVTGNAGAALDGAIGAAPPANALQVALRASSTNPTNATTGNAVAPLATLAGSQVVTLYNNRTLIKHQATAVAVTAETTIITAGGAGVFNDLLTLVISTAAATAGTLIIRDVTAAGTPITINYPNALLAPALPLAIALPVPLSQGTAASAWTITNSQAVAINVTAQYVQRLG